MQNKITVGIIREGRVPHDFRTPFTPDQIAQLNIEFPAHKFVVQHSPFRCYSDNEYLSKGVEVCNDMSHCDILFGIKEVPVDWLYVETRRVNPIKDSIEGLLDLIQIKRNIIEGKYD